MGDPSVGDAGSAGAADGDGFDVAPDELGESGAGPEPEERWMTFLRSLRKQLSEQTAALIVAGALVVVGYPLIREIGDVAERLERVALIGDSISVMRSHVEGLDTTMRSATSYMRSATSYVRQTAEEMRAQTSLLQQALLNQNQASDQRIQGTQQLIGIAEQRLSIEIDHRFRSLGEAVRLVASGNPAEALRELERARGHLPQGAVERSASPKSVVLFREGMPDIDLMLYLHGVLEEGIRFSEITGPQWHPIYPRILFAGIPEDSPRTPADSELYVFDFVTKELIALTDDSTRDHQAKWSPDGEEITFVRVESGQSGVFVMPASGLLEEDPMSTGRVQQPHAREGDTKSRPRLVAGFDPDGPFYQVFFPTYSPFDGWVMVTAEDERENYGLWMVNLESGQRVELLPDRSWHQCKGNLKKMGERKAMLVFNEFREPRGFDARIVTTQVIYTEGEEDPFSLSLPEVILHDGGRNEAPEFADSVDRIVFTTQAGPGDRSRLRMASRQEGEWALIDGRLGDDGRYDYHFPDWRADYTIEALGAYVRSPSIRQPH